MTEENDEEWVIPVDYGDVLEGERETQLLYEVSENDDTSILFLFLTETSSYTG